MFWRYEPLDLSGDLAISVFDIGVLAVPSQEAALLVAKRLVHLDSRVSVTDSGSERRQLSAEPQTAEAGRYEAFMSYAREDGVLAERLAAALEEQGKDVWLDLEDIVAGADWQARVKRGIEACKAFVFVLSPDSLSSSSCRQEVDHAAALKKLIIPVYHRQIDEDELPAALADREWVFLREGDSFEKGLGKLVEAMETDLEWRDQHTRLAGRTREWLDAGRDRSFLVRGSDLRDAETWLAQQGNHRETATAEQAEYIVQSRRAASARQRALMGAVLTALVITVGLTVFALIQRNTALNQKRLAFARELAAASGARRAQDPELALLLGIEAARTQDIQQTEDALRDALSDVHLRTILPVGTRPVTSAAYRADGKAILTASDDGDVRLWRPGARTPMFTMPAGPPGETHAAFAGRGRLVLTTNSRSATRLWDTATRRVVRTLPDRKYNETAGAVSRDATRIVTAARYEKARVWTRGRPHPQVIRAPGQELINSAAISPDGRLVATAPEDGYVRLWSPARPVTSRALPGSGQASFGSVAFGAKGRVVIAASDDGSIQAWDVRSGPPQTLVSESGGTLYPVSSLAARLSQDNELLAAGRSDGTLVLKDISREGRDFTTQTAGGQVHDVGFAPDGRTVVTAQEDGTARIFSVTLVDALSALLRGSTTAFNDVAFSPNGRQVAGADNLGTVHVWTRAGRPVWKVRLRREQKQVTFSPDGKLLAVAGPGGTQIWPVSASRPTLRLRDASSDAAFSHDGRLLAVGAQNGVLQVRRLPAGRIVETLGNTRGQPLQSVAFSPDDSRVLTVGEFGAARIWTRGDKRTPLVLGHRPTQTVDAAFSGRNQTADAAFSPDGASVALAQDKGRVAIANLTAPSEYRTVTVGTETLASVTWSADSRLLLVASQDGKATVLDASRLQPLTTFVASGESLSRASFDPSARFVALAGDSERVEIHRCDLCGSTERLLTTARSIAARQLTKAERQQYLHEGGS